MSAADIVVAARDASYSIAGYRSFEFATFEARIGRTCALLSSEPACARDLLLAIAGFLRPVSGSLEVAGAELSSARALRGKRPRRAAVPPRGTVGIGIFAAVADVPTHLTVEEVVMREMRLRAPRGAAGRAAGADTLDYLASFNIATQSSRHVSQLGPRDRARLSAALACVGSPQVAVVDLGDPFIGALSHDDALALAGEMGAAARTFGLALVFSSSDPAVACAADRSFALDIDASEALRTFEADMEDSEVSAS